MILTFNQIKAKADKVRNIPLIDVLIRANAVKDKYDKHKWHTAKDIISVNDQKFFNWNNQAGGGGAIDLAIHLFHFDFKTAVIWLENHFLIEDTDSLNSLKNVQKPTFILPRREDRHLPKILHYLKNQRSIPLSLINHLLLSGKIYADNKANVVFLLLGKGKKVVGAELRGTSHRRWLGMAKGSRKDLGAFYIKSQYPKIAVICESAIDAISFFTLQKNCIAISTAGANPNPPWLEKLLGTKLEIFCGFDSDETGDMFADQMIRMYPQIKRLRPHKHDWNEVLKFLSISLSLFLNFSIY